MCSECNEGFALEGNDKENCKDKSIFTNKYFTKDEITYFKCDDKNNEGVENCNICNYNNDQVECIQCKDEYILIDEETDKCYLKENTNNKKYYTVDEYHKNKCSKTIENCDECENESGDLTCQKCIDEFAFIGEDRTICKKKIELIEYYSKNNGISYYKCDDLDNSGIQNCETCQYDINEDKLICTKCKNEYILKDEDTDNCYANDNYNNNNQYYYKDEYHVRQCSLDITNCLECEKSGRELKHKGLI